MQFQHQVHVNIWPGRLLWWEKWYTSERPGVSCRNVCGTQVQTQPTLKCQLNLNNSVEEFVLSDFTPF